MANKFERLNKSIAYPIIAKYFKSGELSSTFYRKEGLSENQFYTWRSRYMKEYNMPSIVESVQSEASFHPIQLSTPAQLDNFTGQIELEYPNGVYPSCQTHIEHSRIASLIRLY